MMEKITMENIIRLQINELKHELENQIKIIENLENDLKLLKRNRMEFLMFPDSLEYNMYTTKIDVVRTKLKYQKNIFRRLDNTHTDYWKEYNELRG